MSSPFLIDTVPISLLNKGLASPEDFFVFTRGNYSISSHYQHTCVQEALNTLLISRSLLFLLSIKTHHLLKRMTSDLFLYSHYQFTTC